MAKTNVNTASRDELVEAGVRADLADEILKLRRKGKITSADAPSNRSRVNSGLRPINPSATTGVQVSRPRQVENSTADSAGSVHRMN